MVRTTSCHLLLAPFPGCFVRGAQKQFRGPCFLSPQHPIPFGHCLGHGSDNLAVACPIPLVLRPPGTLPGPGRSFLGSTNQLGVSGENPYHPSCVLKGGGVIFPHLISSVRCIRENRDLQAISVCHTGLPNSNHRVSDRRHLVLNPKSKTLGSRGLSPVGP